MTATVASLAVTRKDQVWKFLLCWVLANAVGGAVGGLIAGVIVIPAEAFRGVLIWAPIAAAQALVLPPQIERRRWLLASALGGTLGVLLFWLATLLLYDTGEEKPLTEALWAGTLIISLAAAAAGAVVGIAQYSVLRRHAENARSWAIVNAAAWAVSLTAGAGLLEYYGFQIIFPNRLFYWSALYSAVYAHGSLLERTLSILVFMVVQAGITGLALTRLLWRRS